VRSREVGNMNDYSGNWRRYRKVNILGVLLGLSGLIVMAGLIYFNNNLFFDKNGSPVLGVVLIVIWGAAMATIAIRAHWWRCPRCGKRFGILGMRKAQGPWSWGIYSRKCVHCGLPRYANTDSMMQP
jgi:hypothetical protein